MKRHIVLLAVFLFSLLAFAQQTMQDANRLYDEGRFEEAIAIYEHILSEGKESTALYFNLGNAFFRINDFASAILNYERALLLSPNNEDVLHNLALARSHIIDRIDVIEPFFLRAWINSLAELMSSNAWAVLCVVTFILFIVALFCYVFGRYKQMKKTAFFAACFLLLISISSFFLAQKLKERYVVREYAIVFYNSTAVRSTPHIGGTVLFELNKGTKVRIRRVFENPEWVEIQIPDGNTGWLENSSIVII